MTDPVATPRSNDSLDSHPATWPEEQLLSHCKLAFSRASGPGGQNRNKVETSVQIEYLPNQIIAAASERRTQNENRKVALQRLRCKLAVEVRAPSQEKKSETWNAYCRDGRIDIAESNYLWPAVLAELIDALSSCDWNLSMAASSLETSSSQIVKVLKKYPPAFSLLNQERKLRGQKSLD